MGYIPFRDPRKHERFRALTMGLAGNFTRRLHLIAFADGITVCVCMSERERERMCVKIEESKTERLSEADAA